MRNSVVGLGSTAGSAEPPPDQKRSNTHQHDPDGRPQPEKGNREPPRLTKHPHKPHRGEDDLERHEDEAMETSGALIAAGKPSRDGGLVSIGDALAASDGVSDASARLHAEAMLEGESPLGITALADLIVHCAVVPQLACPPSMTSASLTVLAGCAVEDGSTRFRSGCVMDTRWLGLVRSGKHGRPLTTAERRGLVVQVVAGIFGIALAIAGVLQIVRAGQEHNFGGVLVAVGCFMVIAGGLVGMRVDGLPPRARRFQAAALLFLGFGVVISLVGYLRGW